MKKYSELIEELLANPNKLKEKVPFTRGANRGDNPMMPPTNDIGQKIDAVLPTYTRRTISQETYMRELDIYCHDVLFDDNIPSICIKVGDGGYKEIVYEKQALPIQKMILEKQVMHLTANDMQFTLSDINPTDTSQECFIIFKQYWKLRNQDGMKNKMVYTQLSLGDAGLLYYFDRFGCIKSRILSYADGYVLCPHNDANGDRIMESVYYAKDNQEFIDSYDDTYFYRHRRTIENSKDWSEWELIVKEPHGFEEIPLITKRGEVAWDSVQPLCVAYEELYNIFNTIQKRLGWGILYIKGKFKDDGRRIAGNVILNDTSIDNNGDAKFLSPPSPEGYLDTMQQIMESIQLGSSTTFLLPKDIKMSGDISGIAIQLTQSLDLKLASQKVIDWQNVADKQTRLFKYGLAKELVNKKIRPTAITDFSNLNINAQFKVWRPMNKYEYNQMLTQLVGADILSKESGVELNTESKPDEKMRLAKQAENTTQQQTQQVNNTEF